MVKLPRSLRLRYAALVAAPTLAVTAYFALSGSRLQLSHEASATAAVVVLMAGWWMTEAIPLAATALLPIVLFPLAGVYPAEEGPLATVVQSYGHQSVFLNMGGFIIALGFERWNLHRRIALNTLATVGTQPRRLIAGFMIATAGLSMWITNTATTLMMLPIATSIVALLFAPSANSPRGEKHGLPDSEQSLDPDVSRFATCLMLCIAYAASLGGMSTLIGTSTNVFVKGYLEDHLRPLSFGSWMAFALPLSVTMMVITAFVLTKYVFPFQLPRITEASSLIRNEVRKLGPVSRGEWSVMAVFSATAFLWVFRGALQSWTWLTSAVPAVGQLNDAVIAMMGALALFLIPVSLREGQFAMDWRTAERLPWGILLLLGGGISLARAVDASGLGEAIGHWVGTQTGLSAWVLVVVVTAVIVFMTELTSNLATVTLFTPILAESARGMTTASDTGVDPMLLIIPAMTAASCAFMLPVATPPNAIVFASGYVRMPQMMQAGLLLNLLAILLIPVLLYTLGPLILGIRW